MKKISITLFFLILFSFTAIAGWTQQTSGTTKSIYSVFFADTYNGWAVGMDGLILKTTDSGINWTQNPSFTQSHLKSVFFVNVNVGWIVGFNGKIFYTNDAGETWQQQVSGTTSWLYKVFFANATTGWAVGLDGIILNTTDAGANWTKQTSGSASFLTSVFFVDANNGWIVGEDTNATKSLILKTTDAGQNWVQQPSINFNHFEDVFFADNNKGWIVGLNGTILYTTNAGVDWLQQSSGTNLEFTDVYFLDINIGWVIGQGGLILKTTNGGTAWIQQTTGTIQELMGVSFVNQNTGWAVGDQGTILKYSDSAGSQVRIISLNNGESLCPNTNYEIQWDGVPAGDTVRIEYSTNNGTDWILITDSATGLKYNWKVPFTPSTSCAARVITKTTKTTTILDTIKIGNQVWMQKNLDVDHYRNGEPIPNVTDSTEWANLTTGAWCYYNNDSANGAIYGKLYNWYAVNDYRGLAPEGWHIPNDAEWSILSTYLGGESISGWKMKETGTTHWEIPNTGATNESGFTGLPGGWRSYPDGSFLSLRSYGYWWTSSDFNATLSWSRSLISNDVILHKDSYSMEYGFSVRCIKD